MLHVRRGRILESIRRRGASLREFREAARIFFSRQMYRHARSVYQMVLERSPHDAVAARALDIIEDQLGPEGDTVYNLPAQDDVVVIVSPEELDIEKVYQDTDAFLDHWEQNTPVDIWGVIEVGDAA